ncbi:MAG TPA: molybdenum cofactor guanylyltransferase [Chloroflexota bacterium]
MSALVLAGGQSRRLGRDKAQLQIGRESILDRTIRVLRRLTTDVLAVGRKAEGQYATFTRFLPDERPDAGPLGGLYTGLRNARGANVVAVACDLPYLDIDALHYLLGLIPGYDAVIPVVGGREQPLHAVYIRTVTPTIERRLDEHELQLSGLLRELHVRFVREEELVEAHVSLQSFVNVNTLEEWHLIERDAD